MNRYLCTRSGICGAALALAAALLLTALALASCTSAGRSAAQSAGHSLLQLARSASGSKPAWSMFGGVDGTGKRRSPHFGPAKGTVKWKYTAYSNIVGSPVVAPDGTVYFESGAGEADGLARIYALTSSGTLKWTARTDVTDWGTASNTLAVGSDGTLYSGHLNNLTAFNPDGSQKWKYVFSTFTGNDIQTAMAIAPNGQIVLLARCDPYNTGYYFVTAMNPDGTLGWARTDLRMGQYQLGVGNDGTIYSSGALVNTSNVPQLTAFNPDGSTKWVSGLIVKAGYAHQVPPTVADDGTIYQIQDNGSNTPLNLYAVSPVDGSYHVAYAFPASYYVSVGMAFAPDGSISLATSSDYTVPGTVYSVWPSSGTLKYSYTNRSYHTSPSAPAVDANNAVYLGTFDGTIIALTPGGNLAWSVSLGTGWGNAWNGKEIFSSSAVADDGTVYICGGNSKNLFAIGPGTP